MFFKVTPRTRYVQKKNQKQVIMSTSFEADQDFDFST